MYSPRSYSSSNSKLNLLFVGKISFARLTKHLCLLIQTSGQLFYLIFSTRELVILSASEPASVAFMVMLFLTLKDSGADFLDSFLEVSRLISASAPLSQLLENSSSSKIDSENPVSELNCRCKAGEVKDLCNTFSDTFAGDSCSSLSFDSRFCNTQASDLRRGELLVSELCPSLIAFEEVLIACSMRNYKQFSIFGSSFFNCSMSLRSFSPTSYLSTMSFSRLLMQDFLESLNLRRMPRCEVLFDEVSCRFILKLSGVLRKDECDRC